MQMNDFFRAAFYKVIFVLRKITYVYVLQMYMYAFSNIDGCNWFETLCPSSAIKHCKHGFVCGKIENILSCICAIFVFDRRMAEQNLTKTKPWRCA